MFLKCLCSAGYVRPQWINSLWPIDAIWHHRFGSTLVQLMVCCLTIASHYLNPCIHGIYPDHFQNWLNIGHSQDDFPYFWFVKWCKVSPDLPFQQRKYNIAIITTQQLVHKENIISLQSKSLLEQKQTQNHCINNFRFNYKHTHVQGAN